MTDEQFDKFLDNCYEELEHKQSKLFEEYNIGRYESYWFDQCTKTLQFKNRDKVELEFRIVCIGTWSHLKNTWMWGWSNESFTEEIRHDAEGLKKLKALTGFDIFEDVGFKCDEGMAYEITAMGVNQLNALGMYKIPGQRSQLFLALIEEKKL